MAQKPLAELEQEHAELVRRRDAALAELKGAEEGCRRAEESLAGTREREETADSELSRASNAFDALDDGELRQLHLLLVQAASAVRETPARELDDISNIDSAPRAVRQTYELLHGILSQSSGNPPDLTAQVKRTLARKDLLTAVSRYDSAGLLSGRVAPALWDRYLGGERGAGGLFADQHHQWRVLRQAAAQRKTEVAATPPAGRRPAAQSPVRRMGTWHGRGAAAEPPPEHPPSTSSSFASTTSTVLGYMGTVLGYTGPRGGGAPSAGRTQSLGTQQTLLPKIKGALSMKDLRKEPPPSALSVEDVCNQDEVAGSFLWWCLCLLMSVRVKAKAPANIAQQASYLEGRIESLEREIEGLRTEAAAHQSRLAGSREGVSQVQGRLAGINGDIYRVEAELQAARDLDARHKQDEEQRRLEEERRTREQQGLEPDPSTNLGAKI